MDEVGEKPKEREWGFEKDRGARGKSRPVGEVIMETFKDPKLGIHTTEAVKAIANELVLEAGIYMKCKRVKLNVAVGGTSDTFLSEATYDLHLLPNRTICAI